MSERTTSKILIVDDDEGVTQTFARMLRLEGYQVRTAVSAENGLREAEESHPDAIILDLRMPLVDGLGFLRRLRAHDDQRDTPVAIVTGDYFLDDAGLDRAARARRRAAVQAAVARGSGRPRPQPAQGDPLTDVGLADSSKPAAGNRSTRRRSGSCARRAAT